MSHLDSEAPAKWYGPTNTPGPSSADGLKTEYVERPAGYVPHFYQAMLNEEHGRIADTFDLEEALEKAIESDSVLRPVDAKPKVDLVLGI
jgi:hypothetical protein